MVGATLAGVLFDSGLTQADERPANMVKAQSDVA